MAAPDLLTTVGFEKAKIGSGDKESGYQIKESSLAGLLGSVLTCFAVMGFMVVMMVYDIHFEKKTLHRQHRIEEHHAASKLAQVQMALWSQYRDDIQESQEAGNLLHTLNSSYSEFQGKFRSAVDDFAKELNINTVKASSFADKILHLVAAMQESNVKHAKRLLDHLVEAGKKGAVMKEHVNKEIMKDIKVEEKRIEQDISEGEGDIEHPKKSHEGAKKGDSEPIIMSEKEKHEKAEEEQDDPLHATLDGFFFVFNDYESEFGGKVRDNFLKGSKAYDQLKALNEKITSNTPPSEEEVQAEFDKIDLEAAGAGLGSGRILPLNDIIDELTMITKIPHEKLKKLEHAWKDGTKDSVTVLAELTEMHFNKELPSGWLSKGVDEEEKEEEKEEKEASGKTD